MIEPTELIVIGAGPGGMQAAITAANAGLQVTLIDSNPLPGGQYFKQIPEDFSVSDDSNHQKEAFSLINDLNNPLIKFFSKTLVWGIFHNPKTNLWQTTFQGENCPARLETSTIIIASGAYDRSIPFPGWDLPGVITAGAAQVMVKSQGILPGKRVIVSGTGPLQLAAAANLVDAGAEVLEILECNRNLLQKGFPHLTSVWGQWKRMQEGFDYAGSLLKARVPYRVGSCVVSVTGDGKVEEATIAKLDAQGYPIKASFRNVAVDTVVVGYGLTPSTEFFRLLDLDMSYSDATGVYIPKRNEFFQTSDPGIYAIGDCAGIGGAGLAMLEGKIAASYIAMQSGHLTDSHFKSMLKQMKIRLKREQKFAKMLEDVFGLPKGLFTLAEPDTIICRCEQISLAEVKEAVSFGAQSITDIKNITRSGMGNCQGRTCGSILTQILAHESHRSPADGHYLHIRPPVHPILLNNIEEKDAEAIP